MTRPVAAPPPEVIDSLSGLVSLVLNAEACAKVIADLKGASDDYQKARLDYETSIGLAARAKQELLDAQEQAKPLLEKAVSERAALAEDLAAVARGKSELENGWANLNSKLEQLAADQGKFAAERAAYEDGIADRIAKADQKIADAEEMRSTIEAKLAILKA